MTVWIISEGVHYSGEGPKGVFSTEAFARDYMDELMKNISQFPGYDHWVWNELDSMFECHDHYIVIDSFEVNIPTPVV